MNANELQEKLRSLPGAVVYFTQNNCSPCEALRPRIKEMVENHFSKMELFFVELEKHKDASSVFDVFAAPTILVFFEGREYLRKGMNLSVHAFQEEIGRIYSMAFGDDE